MKKGFRQTLKERQKRVNSVVCGGLDPLEEKIPECIKGGPLWIRVFIHMREIIDASHQHISLFKPQKAHYEAFPDGQKALQAIVNHIHYKYPDIPVFLDCKRGDIGRTQERYRIAHLDIDGVDGMNFSPYMGKECMAKLVDETNGGKAIVGLCRTSNPDAWEIQDILLADGRKNWEYMAERILQWAEDLKVVDNAGLVMGAAHPGRKIEERYHIWRERNPNLFYYDNNDFDGIYTKHLTRVRQIVGNLLWFLIPGIGTQNKTEKETVIASYAGPGSIAVSSSSAFIFASNGKDFAEAAANEARRMKDEMNEAIKCWFLRGV